MGFEPIFKQRKCSVLTVRRQVIFVILNYYEKIIIKKFCLRLELNQRHNAFQTFALPLSYTE